MSDWWFLISNFKEENWILSSHITNCKDILKPIVHIVSNEIKYDNIGFKFAKKFDSKFYTGTVTQIGEGNVKDISRKIVYNDGDEEKLSLLQIRALKKNFKHVENITFNDSISCGEVGFHFRKKFKNHGFFIGCVSEILQRNK